MAKIQIKTEKVSPFGGFFQLWVHLTDFWAKLSIPHSVSDANWPVTCIARYAREDFCPVGGKGTENQPIKYGLRLNSFC